MVEIVMSTYNGEQWIDEQIESIARQTYTDWQLTIRDDGSTDKTISILEKWKERLVNRIRLVKGENIGVVKSFESLIRMAEGEYIMMADQDDVWLEKKIEMTISRMKEEEQKHPGKAILVFTSVLIADENLKSDGTTFFEQHKFRFPFAMKFENICVNNCVAGCTTMINRKAKEMVMPFAGSVMMHDWWMAARIARDGILSVIEEPTMLYRQHSDNLCGVKKAGLSHYAGLILSPWKMHTEYNKVEKFLKDVGFSSETKWLCAKMRHLIYRQTHKPKAIN